MTSPAPVHSRAPLPTNGRSARTGKPEQSADGDDGSFSAMLASIVQEPAPSSSTAPPASARAPAPPSAAAGSAWPALPPIAALAPPRPSGASGAAAAQPGFTAAARGDLDGGIAVPALPGSARFFGPSGVNSSWHLPFPPGVPSQAGDVLSAAAVLTAAQRSALDRPARMPAFAPPLPGGLYPPAVLPLPGEAHELPSSAGLPAWPDLPLPPAAPLDAGRPWFESTGSACPLCAGELSPGAASAHVPCGALFPRCCSALKGHVGLRCLTRTLRPAPLCESSARVVCPTCLHRLPASHFSVSHAGTLAPTCRACASLAAHSHAPSGALPGVDDREARLEDAAASLNASLRAAPLVRRKPAEEGQEGQKACVLCRKVFPLDHFGKGGNGKLNGYCRPCQVLVVRGNRKGIRAAQLRQALEDGTLELLLPPVTHRSKSQKISEPAAEGMKRCGMCLQELPCEQFDQAKDGNLRGYCHACHCLVGRANKKGIKAAELRKAIAEGRLETLLPPVKERASKAAGSDDTAYVERPATDCPLCCKPLAKEQMDKSSPAWLRGYCVECHRLVGRAGRQGIKMEMLREAVLSDTVADLLAAHEAPVSKPNLVAPPGHKGCQLCQQVLALDQFGVVGNGRRRGYCQRCHLLSGRANKRGIRVSQLRAAILSGTVDDLLPLQPSVRGDGGAALMDGGADWAAPGALPPPPGEHFCSACQVPMELRADGQPALLCKPCEEWVLAHARGPDELGPDDVQMLIQARMMEVVAGRAAADGSAFGNLDAQALEAAAVAARTAGVPHVSGTMPLEQPVVPLPPGMGMLPDHSGAGLWESAEAPFNLAALEAAHQMPHVGGPSGRPELPGSARPGHYAPGAEQYLGVAGSGHSAAHGAMPYTGLELPAPPHADGDEGEAPSASCAHQLTSKVPQALSDSAPPHRKRARDEGSDAADEFLAKEAPVTDALSPPHHQDAMPVDASYEDRAESSAGQSSSSWAGSKSQLAKPAASVPPRKRLR